MTEDGKDRDLGPSSYKGGFTIGVSLIIWSLAGIAFGAALTGSTLAGNYTVILFIFPPIGAYLIIDSVIGIARVLQNERE